MHKVPEIGDIVTLKGIITSVNHITNNSRCLVKIDTPYGECKSPVPFPHSLSSERFDSIESPPWTPKVGDLVFKMGLKYAILAVVKNKAWIRSNSGYGFDHQIIEIRHLKPCVD